MSSTNIADRSSPEVQPTAPDPRRWKALGVLGVIQFMMVLDVTVVNVALPQIQRDLGTSQQGLAWIVNAYIIMAGGLLLLGGRMADVFGRRRLFMLGITVFATASAVCGLAPTSEILIGGRFVQGVGEAMAAPAALGLIALLFTDTRERMKALGIWGGISGIAGISGVVISGLFTGLISWRLIFLINIPIALAALLLVPVLVSESRMRRENATIDYTGGIVGTAGLLALVYGLLQAAESAWFSPNVLLPILGGLGLIVTMFVVEARSPAPLIPLRFFRNRTRVAANILGLFFSAGFFSYIFLLTLYLQQVLGFDPLRGGLAYLPFGLSLGLGVGIGTGLMQKIGVRPLFSAGFFGVALGLLVTSGIEPTSSYLTGVLPGMILVGFFSGLVVPGGSVAALHQVTEQDSSLAAGVQNAVQQIGGALGIASLITLSLRWAAGEIATGVSPDQAATDGYATAFRVIAVFLIVCGFLVLVLIENISATPPGQPAAEAESDVAADQTPPGPAAAAAAAPRRDPALPADDATST